MAIKQNETKAIEYVTCIGCMFIEPCQDFKGHGYCSNRAVKMITVIETLKQCIWKQKNG